MSDQSAFDVPSLLADGHCSEYFAVYPGETDLTQPTLFFPELFTCQLIHVLNSQAMVFWIAPPHWQPPGCKHLTPKLPALPFQLSV